MTTQNQKYHLPALPFTNQSDQLQDGSYNVWISTDFEAESNLFVEPYRELWKKLLGTAFYILQILVGLIILAFVRYEREGLAGHFRTALNQLTSWKYLVVSYYISN